MSWRNVREICCGMGVAWDGTCVLSWGWDGIGGGGGLLKRALGLLMDGRVGWVGETALIYAMTAVENVCIFCCQSRQ